MVSALCVGLGRHERNQMSIDVSTETIIGIEVERGDFIVTELLFNNACPTHGPIVTKYCDECGASSDITYKHTPTPALMVLSKHVGIDPRKFVWDDTPDDFLIHGAEQVQGSESVVGAKIMGVVVSSVGDCMYESDDFTAISIPDFMNIYERVRGLVVKCDFDPCNIKMYHTAFVGR